MMDWNRFNPNPATRVPFQWTSPDSFCRFLCGLLTPGSPEEIFWNSVLKRNLKASVFAKEVAPKGLWCARGLKNLPKPIKTKADVEEILSRKLAVDDQLGHSYSLNVTAATVFFTLGHYFDQDRLGKLKLMKGRSFGKSEGMLIVSKLQPKDITEWGSDSESGLFYEAEIRSALCEPRCVQSVFLCSKEKRAFRKASKAERDTYALDEHIEVRWKEMPGVHWSAPYPYSNSGLAILSPSCTVCKGPTVTSIKKVRHTPKGYDWYRVL